MQDVAVVVPVYNASANVIESTGLLAFDAMIESLLGQDLGGMRVELHFVDDSSPDNSMEMLSSAAERLRAMYIVHVHQRPNSGGAGAPRNVGLMRADAQFVLFLDQDDQLSSRALRDGMELARRSNADIVYLRASGLHGYAVTQAPYARGTLLDAPARLTGTSLSSVGKLYRVAMLREHRITYFERWRYCEDILFNYTALAHASRVAVLADEPNYYFVRTTNHSSIAHEGTAISVRPEPTDIVSMLLGIIPRELTELRAAVVEKTMMWTRRFYAQTVDAGGDPDRWQRIYRLHSIDALAPQLSRSAKDLVEAILTGDADLVRAVLDIEDPRRLRVDTAEPSQDVAARSRLYREFRRVFDELRIDLNADGQHLAVGTTPPPGGVMDVVFEGRAQSSIRHRFNSHGEVSLDLRVLNIPDGVYDVWVHLAVPAGAIAKRIDADKQTSVHNPTARFYRTSAGSLALTVSRSLGSGV